MAEASLKKGNRGKETVGGNDRKNKDAKKEKRETFFQLLRQVGFIDDQFAQISEETIKEISETIGRKKVSKKATPPENIRLQLKKYYYKTKLEEVEQELKAWKHSWKEEKTSKLVHEESPNMNNESGQNYHDSKSERTSEKADFINNLGNKNLRGNAYDATDKYHKDANQSYSKEAGGTHASVTNVHETTESESKSINKQKYRANDQQQPTTTNAFGHQQKSNDLADSSQKSKSQSQTMPTNDVTNTETSNNVDGITNFENLECDGTQGTRGEEGVDNYSEKIYVTSKNIEDILSEDEIKTLSNRQLLEILSSNAVNCKGVCERKDLLTLVQRLWEHKQEEARDGDYSMTSECTICMNARIDCAFLECGHLVTCIKCGQTFKECPICRTYITRAVHIFRS